VDRAHRRLLALLGLAVLFEGYGRSFVSVTLAPIGSELGAAPNSLSYAMALIAAGALGILVLGPLIDRFGRRRVLLASVVGYSVFGAATAAGTTLWHVVLWQAIARMFQEGALYSAAVIAAEEMPAARRGTAQGLLGIANNMGGGLVAFLFAFIRFVPGGWRGLGLVAVAPLGLLPFLRRSIPESTVWVRQAAATRPRLPPGYGRRVAVALAVVLLGTAYDVAGFGFTSYYPMTAHGWTERDVATMIIVAGGAGLPGWWVGGRLADHVGRRLTAATFLVGLAAAQAGFFLGGAHWLWPGFTAMVFFQGGKTAVLRAWATELFPTALRGTAAGWLSAAATAGGIGGFTVAGALSTTLGLAPALVTVAAGGVAAAALSFLLPETRGITLDAIAPSGASGLRAGSP
jgi:MFS family permease